MTFDLNIMKLEGCKLTQIRGKKLREREIWHLSNASFCASLEQM